MRPRSPNRSSPRRNNSSSHSRPGGFGIARALLYLVGIGCFAHVVFVGPPRTTAIPPLVDVPGETSRPRDSSSSMDTPEEQQQASNDNEGIMDKVEDTLPGQVAEKVALATTTASVEVATSVSSTTAEAATTEAVTEKQVQATTAATEEDPSATKAAAAATGEAKEETVTVRTTPNPDDCPVIETKESTKVYRKDFAKNYPVKVPFETVEDWNAIPCSNMPPNCDLQDTSHGHPFIMISFGRAGTTSTWDIIAALTGEYIPKASEDMGRDKGEAEEFFAALNHTEHGKCWLERLLCEKQQIVKKAEKKGLGKAAIFGSKWKPWHLGLNTTQARQALQWLGTQKQIKVLHNTRNMVDMFISQYKHVVLNRLFGNERTAHCYDDRDIKLSDKAWGKLEAMGISRGTPCVQIFKQIESRTSLKVGHMVDYFERNSIQTDYVVDMLDYYDVSRVTVTYEKLYFTDNAKEWTRIFKFLGFGPQKNLTLDQVFATTTFQKTSANDRSKRMANYDEVYKALQCTRYGKYLDD